MIRIHISAEIHEDRRVVLQLPEETPTGKAELTVTISPQGAATSSAGHLRQHFGSVHSGDAKSADNDRIDADLARAYGDSHDKAT
ncbi:MAG: hypothetical protein KatS3mg111_3471 [Pirellulaceae bacterium]|nr:MAG: hypothetical protein KatS3mg111_3471 [Pirellulaceae bacterium]